MSIVYDFISIFNNYAREYPVIAGAISLWFLGVLSYFGRNIPAMLWEVIKKQGTTKLTIISTHDSYFKVLFWMTNQDLFNNLRALKFSSGRWGDVDCFKFIGYGNHYLRYKNYFFSISLTQQESQARMERDTLTITVLGRTHGLFNEIFNKITEESISKLSVSVFTNDNGWHFLDHQKKRKKETIFISGNAKQEVFDYLNKFYSMEDWYFDKGLSFRTGVLLYGPPGTGKTSLIKAVASYFNKELLYIPVACLDKIEDAFNALPKDCIVVIEDIDQSPIITGDPSPLQKGNLSSILNVIDGASVVHGRVLFATTNDINKLPKNLLRSGRFDLKVEIPYADMNCISDFFEAFYPGFIIPDDFYPTPLISPALIESSIIQNLNSPEEVLRILSC